MEMLITHYFVAQKCRVWVFASISFYDTPLPFIYLFLFMILKQVICSYFFLLPCEITNATPYVFNYKC